MDKELKIGQSVRSVDFKKTRAIGMKNAIVWNWECPKLLENANIEAHHKLVPTFIQFLVECQKFETKGIYDIYEYRVVVGLLDKRGKPYRMSSCTFNETDEPSNMWEKILGMIYAAAKSQTTFNKFLAQVWDGKSPKVFRLAEIPGLIKESIVSEAKTGIEKEFEFINKLKPSQIGLKDDAYGEKWAQFTWMCPEILSQLEEGYDYELKFGGKPVGIRIQIRIKPNTDFEVSKKKSVGEVYFAVVDDKDSECSSDVYTEDIYGSPNEIVKEVVRFLKIIGKDMEAFRIFVGHVWEPGYSQRWSSSLNEISRKITGQSFGNQYH